MITTTAPAPLDKERGTRPVAGGDLRSPRWICGIGPAGEHSTEGVPMQSRDSARPFTRPAFGGEQVPATPPAGMLFISARRFWSGLPGVELAERSDAEGRGLTPQRRSPVRVPV